MKKVLPIFSAVLLMVALDAFFTFSPTVKADQTVTVTFRVIPQELTVKLGQPFCVNITFENIPNLMPENGVTGVQFELTWNSSILLGVSMQDIAFHTAAQNDSSNIWGIQNEIASDHAVYAYTWIDIDRGLSQGYAPFMGNGTWASINFVSVGSGETDLNLSQIELGGWLAQNIILGVGVDGKVSVTKMLAGDIDQDGTVNSTDASMLAAAFGSTPHDSNWNPNADINNDGVVDILDAIILADNFGRTLT